MLPQDPFILLSYVNTRLRDRFPSLSALCDDEGVEPSVIMDALAAIGYHYDPRHNRFC